MTGRRLEPSALPYWPRHLVREMAAAYVGVCLTLFDEEVAKGLWPPADFRGKRGGVRTWDRILLDAASDLRAGLNVTETVNAASARAIGNRIRDHAKAKGNRPQDISKETP